MVNFSKIITIERYNERLNCWEHYLKVGSNMRLLQKNDYYKLGGHNVRDKDVLKFEIKRTEETCVLSRDKYRIITHFNTKWHIVNAVLGSLRVFVDNYMSERIKIVKVYAYKKNKYSKEGN